MSTIEHERTMRARIRRCQIHRGSEWEPYVCGRAPAVRLEDGRYACRRCRMELKLGLERPDHRDEEAKKRGEMP